MDEIGSSVLEFAAVDQARDRRMVQRRENVPFAVQTAAQPRVQGRVMQHFDGHALPILRVVALSPIHGAHAAVPEDGHYPVLADARAEQSVLMFFEQGFGGRADRDHQGVRSPLIGGEQGLDRMAQIRVVPAGVGQTNCALRGSGVGHLLEHRLDLLPSRPRDHAGRPAPISLSSQARASRMSRCTVASEAPAASAICS